MGTGLNGFPLRSLKTRVTLLALVIFVLGIWALALYTSRMLRADMENQLGHQQFSTVSILAGEIDYELAERLKALETVATGLGPAILDDTTALQARLEQLPLLQQRFNGGVMVLGLNGKAIADVPRSAGRTGINYIDIDTVAAALREGRSTIGRPVMGRKLQAPVFGMTVPIRDTGGRVIGALTGVTNLGKPNFLDRISDARYGETGGYVLIAPQYRLVVTSTNKSRIMQPLPAPGVNPLIDRDVQGYEGHGILVNPLGVEVLSSAKGISAAGWYLAAYLPTAEAFAPIKAMQERLLAATTILTLLVGALTWLMLRRQLSPMLAAVETLAALPNKDQHPLPLPIARRDEVGELIGAFNRLLDALRQREDALRANEAFTASILNSVSAEIAVLDGDGIIVAVNSAWRRFALENAEEPGKPPGFTEVGTDYLAVCEAAGPSGSDGDAALRAAEGIRAVMAGAVPGFRLEYPCHTPEHQRWFSMSVTPLGTDRRGVVIAHTDITELRQAEAQRLADARQHRDTLVREVHHRIKNNLQSVAGLLRRELGRFLTLDPRLETAISQVHAIAAVHGLQSADSDEVVRLCDSTRDICASVAAIAQRPVEFRIENEATTFLPVRIASDEAVSVALVLNELILNAVKHSPEGGPAPSVTLTANGIDARIRIRNAVASPPTFDIDSGAGLGTGLRLVRSLLPAHGAHLGYETNTAGLVHTVLALTSPVVATSGAKLK